MSTEPDDNGVFTEMAEDLETPAYVLIQQNADDDNPEYDLVGDVDLDEAITMTVKGLFMMVADALGWWDNDDDDDEELDP